MKDFASNTDLRSEYYRDHTIAIDMVELQIKTASGANIPQYLCTGGADIAYASPTAVNGSTNVYSAQGDFIGFSPLTEDFDVKVGKFSIYLSGVGNNFVNYLVQNPVEGNRVVVYKAFLNFGSAGTTPLSIVGSPVMMFDGTIYNYAVTESDKSCQITVDCSSLFADFERTAGRKTNNWSNWLYQGVQSDTCMEKAGWVGQTEFKWGKL